MTLAKAKHGYPNGYYLFGPKCWNLISGLCLLFYSVAVLCIQVTSLSLVLASFHRKNFIGMTMSLLISYLTHYLFVNNSVIRV